MMTYPAQNAKELNVHDIYSFIVILLYTSAHQFSCFVYFFVHDERRTSRHGINRHHTHTPTPVNESN